MKAEQMKSILDQKTATRLVVLQAKLDREVNFAREREEKHSGLRTAGKVIGGAATLVGLYGAGSLARGAMAAGRVPKSAMDVRTMTGLGHSLNVGNVGMAGRSAAGWAKTHGGAAAGWGKSQGAAAMGGLKRAGGTIADKFKALLSRIRKPA
jgi:hypothetical protein